MINRETIGRRLIQFAWGVEIVAASIGLTIALLVILATRRTLELSGGEISATGYMDMFLGGLPFIVVAMVELTKIPLATACYTAINRAWKTFFAVALIVLSIITFETILNGFERNFTQRTFLLADLKKRALNLGEQIAKTKADVLRMSEASESKLREAYNLDSEQTEKERQSKLDGIEKERAAARVRFGGDEAKLLDERLERGNQDIAALEKSRATKSAKIDDQYNSQMSRIDQIVTERRGTLETQIKQLKIEIADSRQREEKQLAAVPEIGGAPDVLAKELARIGSDFRRRGTAEREEQEHKRRNLEKEKSELAAMILTRKAEKKEAVRQAFIFSRGRVRMEYDAMLDGLRDRQRQLDRQSDELLSHPRINELQTQKDQQISNAHTRYTTHITRGQRGRGTIRKKFDEERKRDEQRVDKLQLDLLALSTDSQIQGAASKRDEYLAALNKDIGNQLSKLRTQQDKIRNDRLNVVSNSGRNLKPVLNRLNERRDIIIEQIERRQETRRQRYEADIARLVQRDDNVRRLQTSLATLETDRLKRREEIVVQSQNSQIYRIAGLAYGRDSPADITNDELRVVTIIWFGSLAAITAWTGTILAFGSLVVRYGPQERLPKRPGRVMRAARAFLVDRRRRIRKPIIREVEKEIVKVVEVIKEVPVDRVVFKEVPREVVHRELVYVPMFTDDPDLLRESVFRKNGSGGSSDGPDGGGEDKTIKPKPGA